jgi:D-alanyl-lipoteichoic acid acyltransferase DltB (MBOAT superfamily)
VLIDSLAFLIAFPLFCALFFAVPARLQSAVLLIGSAVACASFGWVTFAWLVLITLLGYGFGRRFGVAPSGLKLTTAIVVVVAPLVVLKYTNFAFGSLEQALAWAGVKFAPPHLDATLPIGISFYTFVIIGYLVDVHIERIEAQTSLWRFALFTAFYPKFIAGPVERAETFMAQIDEPRPFDYARVTDGVRIIGGGLFKKLVVADRLAVAVNGVYADIGAFHGLTLVLTGVFYMFQLYYDFCGYSDIAVGTARVLGYNLTWNFNRPYAARSITDYWRRWHISLTSWLFEYIFAPVAAALRTWQGAGVMLALMTTFLVSGFWHGAQWTFVLYGVVHGVALCVDFLTRRPRKLLRAWVPEHLYALLAWAVTFTFVGCGDVLFRSATIGQAAQFLVSMVSGIAPDLGFLAQHHFSPASLKAIVAGLPILKLDLVIAIVAIACVELAGYIGRKRPFRLQLAAQPTWIRWSVYYAVAATMLYLGSQNTATVFIYQKF